MNRESLPEVPPIVAKIRPLLEAAKKKVGTRAFLDGVYNFAKQLETKYPSDFRRRRAYHAMIGSSLPDGAQDIIEEDFPGEDSVVGFLESLTSQ